MRVACKVTCYISDRYMEAGEAYELPDNFPIVEAYFKRLDEPEVAEVKAEETEAVTATTEPENVVEEVAEGFKCEVCGKVCKNKIGLTGHMRSHK
jgi:hypothetical protein